MTFDLSGARVWVAGHRGMVGSAIVRRLADEPISELITATSAELDMRRQDATEAFVADTRPDVLILAAARVGGIQANRSAQGEFLYDNLMINANGIHAAHRGGVRKTVILGSNCIYPRAADQPITEAALLTGPLEPTNEGYAVAKIAALELAKMYRRQYGASMVSLMPTNMYGPNDNFGLTSSHVLPALLRKIHEAKESAAAEVEIWGTGTPRREFLHVDDMADATVHVLKAYDDDSHLNVGVGDDVAIKDLAALIAEVVGWDGTFRFNTEMPDGMPRKLLDSTRLRQTGWVPRIDLRDGLAMTYEWFVAHARTARGIAG